MVSTDQSHLHPTKAMKSFVNARRCRSIAAGGKYRIDKDHQFMVHLVGLLGKLPKSEDIEKTVGTNYDLLSAF
jgi:hypothetical protein